MEAWPRKPRKEMSPAEKVSATIALDVFRGSIPWATIETVLPSLDEKTTERISNEYAYLRAFAYDYWLSEFGRDDIRKHYAADIRVLAQGIGRDLGTDFYGTVEKHLSLYGQFVQGRHDIVKTGCQIGFKFGELCGQGSHPLFAKMVGVTLFTVTAMQYVRGAIEDVESTPPTTS
jgi:hypothetical protein